jgi:hypothetical protein
MYAIINTATNEVLRADLDELQAHDLAYHMNSLPDDQHYEIVAYDALYMLPLVNSKLGHDSVVNSKWGLTYDGYAPCALLIDNYFGVAINDNGLVLIETDLRLSAARAKVNEALDAGASVYLVRHSIPSKFRPTTILEVIE